MIKMLREEGAMQKALTAKKATAVTTERLSGEARLVYTWLMAPCWFERLGAILCDVVGWVDKVKARENVLTSSSRGQIVRSLRHWTTI